MPYYVSSFTEQNYYNTSSSGFKYPERYLLGIHPGSVQDLPAPSAKWIKDNIPNAQDGYYWIDFQSIGPQLVYCIMNSNVSGGGWMAVNSTISPQIFNTSTTSSWGSNSANRLFSQNNSLLTVSIVEVLCGGNSFYTLKSPSDWGINYTETMLIVERSTTLGQCSSISGLTISGWFTGPQFNGSYTSNGTCLWSDGIWANACCNAQNMTGLKLYWVFFGSGTNPLLNYTVGCGGGGGGTHYHMWFVR